MKLHDIEKMLLIILLLLMVLFAISCTDKQDDIVEPVITSSDSNLFRAASRKDVLGAWSYDFETDPTMHGQYVRPYIEITYLNTDTVLLNNTDTLILSSGSTYVGSNWSKLQSGNLSNGVLRHCELYADLRKQTSYYVCVDYR